MTNAAISPTRIIRPYSELRARFNTIGIQSASIKHNQTKYLISQSPLQKKASAKLDEFVCSVVLVIVGICRTVDKTVDTSRRRIGYIIIVRSIIATAIGIGC
jgi:hypothetical protein